MTLKLLDKSQFCGIVSVEPEKSLLIPDLFQLPRIPQAMDGKNSYQVMN